MGRALNCDLEITVFDDHRIEPGGYVSGALTYHPTMGIKRLDVTLLRIESVLDHHVNVRREGRIRIEVSRSGPPYAFLLRVPADGPETFTCANGEVQWYLEAQAVKGLKRESLFAGIEITATRPAEGKTVEIVGNAPGHDCEGEVLVAAKGPSAESEIPPDQGGPGGTFAGILSGKRTRPTSARFIAGMICSGAALTAITLAREAQLRPQYSSWITVAGVLGVSLFLMGAAELVRRLAPTIVLPLIVVRGAWLLGGMLALAAAVVWRSGIFGFLTAGATLFLILSFSKSSVSGTDSEGVGTSTLRADEPDGPVRGEKGKGHAREIEDQ